MKAKTSVIAPLALALSVGAGQAAAAIVSATISEISLPPVTDTDLFAPANLATNLGLSGAVNPGDALSVALSATLQTPNCNFGYYWETVSTDPDLV